MALLYFNLIKRIKAFSKLNIKLYSLVIFTFLASGLYSQNFITKKTANGKAKKFYDRAIQYNRGRHFDKAIKDFESAIKLEPTFIDAHYQLAASFFNQKMYPKAITGLQKVIAIDATYKPQAHYYLGFIYKINKEYEKAVHHFEQFLQSDSSNKKFKTKAEQYLKNCQFAATAIKNPVPFDPKPLSPVINTSFPEYLPSITADGNTLVFTRRIRGDEEVFISHKKEEDWSEAQAIIDINTEANEGSQYISADGNTIVFVRCSDRVGYGSCDLYISEKKGQIWTKPKNMGQPINTRAWESQPSLSADGKVLYFASSRKGSLGGRDIWRSNRKEDGEWSNPVNLGRKINTTADDEAPFFHPDGKTLYFMSTGHIGMGGYDLFVSKRTTNGKWDIPKNLGYPINTTGNEGALFITLDGKTAYFAKDQLPEEDAAKKTSKKQPDIFSFELPESLRPTPVTYVKAVVKDAISGVYLENTKVEIMDLASNEIVSTAYTDPQGVFLNCLALGTNYALNIHKEKYLFHSEHFELDSINNQQNPFLLNINLQPIPTDTISTEIIKPAPIILKNVFFASGSAALKKESLAELNHLRDLLTANKTLKIQIQGHTDNVGSDTDNLILSENRAKAVKEYLVREGVEAARIKYKGFGESQAIDTNDTVEGRKNNRRTEFILLVEDK